MRQRRVADPSSAFLTTSLKDLDDVLHGGLACGALTEITGPSGCGKTQLCIMLSIIATLPVRIGGMDSAVIYIDTESAFSAERLVEMAKHRFPDYFSNEEKLLSTTNRVHVYRDLTCEDMRRRIETLEEVIILKGVKLLVIDSVASVVRKEFDTKLHGNLVERNNFLAKEASSLKYLADEFSMVVILTNQITTWLRRCHAPVADPASLYDDLSSAEGKRASYITAET
ncbi:DNA repair protein RAD51 homolog 2 [Discoglossus pictus]